MPLSSTSDCPTVRLSDLPKIQNPKNDVTSDIQTNCMYPVKVKDFTTAIDSLNSQLRELKKE